MKCFTFPLAISVCLLLAIYTTANADDRGDWAMMNSIVPRGYVCELAREPIVVDGKLSDAAWRSVPWTEEFVDIEADRQPKPYQRTRAKMAWDANNFYIAAEIEERHIQGSITKHDAVIFQDNDFEVFIDPDGDNHQYYELEMNTLNTTWDLFLPRPYKDGGSADNSWEFAGLKTAVDLRGTLNDPADIDQGWSLEIAIPWAAFRPQPGVALPPKSGDQWRIDFSRVQWRFDVVDGKYVKVPKTKENNWIWSPPGIIDMHRPERWGYVEFSTASPGVKTFSHDSSLAIRDALMEIYHRQRTFQKKHGRWAESLSELEFSSALEWPISLTVAGGGYHASLDQPLADGNVTTWYVRQDSRLWSVGQSKLVSEALALAGSNRGQLESALQQVVGENREAMEFLITNMPKRDLQSLSAEFLVENVLLATVARNESPWRDSVPKEIFLNNVLPYANINEGRDAWRTDFRNRCLPLIEGAKSTSQAAAMLNQKLFSLLNVKYSTKRAKADQNPNESIKSGLASCTGLSILLIDACRSVGVPARFVGTPLWSDNSGNHSWVEIWDNGWHFTGAAEPSGDALDQAWFTGRASTALRDDRMKAIYAVSFQKTPITFPLVWDRSIDYVYAVNVSDRYSSFGTKPPEGTATLWIRAIDSSTRERVAADIRVVDSLGKECFAGKSKDGRFDNNDHLTAYLPIGQEFTVHAGVGDKATQQSFKVTAQPTTLSLFIGSVDE